MLIFANLTILDKLHIYDISTQRLQTLPIYSLHAPISPSESITVILDSDTDIGTMLYLPMFEKLTVCNSKIVSVSKSQILEYLTDLSIGLATQIEEPGE